MRFEVSDKKNYRMTFKVDKPIVTVGRGSTMDAKIDTEEVSRNHAILSQVGGRYFIQDVGSTNGIYVNNVKLAKNAKSEVKINYNIGLGPNVTLKLLAEEEPESTSIHVQGPMIRTAITRQTRIVEDAAPYFQEKPKTSAKQREARIKFIAISLVFVAGVYFFFFQTPGPVVTPTVDENALSDPKHIEVIDRLTHGEQSQFREVLVDYKRTCQGLEKEYCGSMTPPFLSGEGAHLKGTELSVFRNLAELGKQEFFDVVPKDIRYDFTLLYYAVSAAINYPKLEGLYLTDIEKTPSNNVLPRAQIYITQGSFRPLTLSEVLVILKKVKDIGDMPDFKTKIEDHYSITYFVDPKILKQN